MMSRTEFNAISARLRIIAAEDVLISPAALSFLLAIISLVVCQFGFENYLWVTMLLGFMVIGLPHGAVDHITNQRLKGASRIASFVAGYLLKAFVLALLWVLLPPLALTVFLVYSAWHFGQTDFTEWSMKSRANAFLWGASLLSIILLFHYNETITIVSEIPGMKSFQLQSRISKSNLHFLRLLPVTLAFFMVLKYRSWNMLFTILYVLMGSLMPLIFSFGIYFIFQHSIQGWKHLKTAMNTSYRKLWIQSLPYSIVGVLFIAFAISINAENDLGIFFVLLSCISIPHVLSMEVFYRNHKISNN